MTTSASVAFPSGDRHASPNAISPANGTAIIADAYTAKSPVTADGTPLRLSKPAYATFEVPTP